ncbi:MAG TPA: TIM barrel protein, partial [Pirellulales bacterium]
MQSSVTISLTPQAKGGPFVFWDDLGEGCRQASELGFDAVEVFPPAPEALGEHRLGEHLREHNLKLAAVGTGAGWVVRKLTLISSDAAIRKQAIEFVEAIVDAAAEHQAPAIIGSMQGRWGDGVSRDEALSRLRDALGPLGERAR